MHSLSRFGTVLLVVCCLPVGYGLRCYNCVTIANDDACARGAVDNHKVPSNTCESQGITNGVCLKQWSTGGMSRSCTVRNSEAMGCNAGRCLCDGDLCNGSHKACIGRFLLIGTVTATLGWVARF
ncbi:hypothetical protein RvY_17912 [Ramazzottius varieornatus]|uniref:Protein quiver n=1 Tax=Ramazzottius varieornatus TaxID=947166 RepID=A0A1D1W413_RAMVA|nr:hypothetical protein RvY_17912 [Ramazzottius varieornatus]